MGTRKYTEVTEGSEEHGNATEKEELVIDKVVPLSIPAPPFPQRLAKKTKEGNYRRFITMLKQL